MHLTILRACAVRQEREIQVISSTMATRQTESHQCPVCNVILASRQSLRRHWNNWHQDRDKANLEEHLRQIDTAGKIHVCPTCGKAYSRSNILKDHQAKVHQQHGLKRTPRFHCTVSGCPASFYFMKDLLQHCEVSHTEQLGIKFIVTW